MIKLFVIDDHYLIIEGLYSSFDLESDDFEVVGGSLSIDEAITSIKPENIDIILLDLFIKQEDPVVNLLKIQNAFPTIPVVIISNESCISWQVEMFRHGVKAYIDKGDDKSEMCQKLLLVYSDEVVMPDEVTRILLTTYNNKHDNQFLSEIKVLIKELSEGLTIKEISSKMRQSESAIEKKLHFARKTYNAKTNIELVHKALVKQTGI